jgi:5-methylcytosine-specific restriction endonuclease McrA
MTRTYIAKELRERVAAQARHRCGYCHTAEAIVGTPMEFDHLIPQSLGGLTEEDNLWLACSLCNDHKVNRIAALDPDSGKVVRLFNPRRQVWAEHFRWSEEGERIVGLTPTGRATVVALNLNRPSLVQARRLWVSVGWHPPRDDIRAASPPSSGPAQSA